MTKKFLTAIFICAVLALITGCTKGTSTSYDPHKETETPKPQPTEPPTLYAINPLFENEEITKIVIIKEAYEENITVEITSEKKIREIIAMFNNWDMEANKVQDKDVMDLGLDIEIIFSDKLKMYTSPSTGADYNYYGSIAGYGYYDYYYLPQEFWEYVINKIS